MNPHSLHRRAITKDEINTLPRMSYDGHIHVVDSDAKMHAAVKALGPEEVLGFDTETRPAFKVGEAYPPALVQLAARDSVYIFQLRHITSYEPLAHILADKSVLKAGVAVRDDIIKLGTVFAFKPAGFVELAEMRVKLGITNAGLRGLAALLFGFKISKRAKISRWDAPELTREQIVYAATDAWICREIYFALQTILRGKVRQTVSSKSAHKGVVRRVNGEDTRDERDHRHKTIDNRPFIVPSPFLSPSGERAGKRGKKV